MALLEVKNLAVHFQTDQGVVRAVDGISYELQEGEILGIVGESGSGKSVSSLAVMGLLAPTALIPSGEILFEEQNLLKLSPKQMRKLRGNRLSMIFQDPFTSLNPYLKVSTQLMEVLEFHSSLSKDQAKKRCLEVLELLGVPEPDVRFNSYPHQLSGGLKQRMMIAMSLLLEPKLLIADEPTTALDVTIQAQILELLKDINQKQGTSIIMITHDLGVVAGLCDRVQVMYAGRLVERGSTDDIFYETKHPYTKGLMTSVPKLDVAPGARLQPIDGSPPDLVKLSDRCAFAERCDRVQDMCWKKRPAWSDAKEGGGHGFACYSPVGLPKGEILAQSS